jgi:hypothetical protein
MNSTLNSQIRMECTSKALILFMKLGQFSLSNGCSIYLRRHCTPKNAMVRTAAIESIIHDPDRNRLRVVVDISKHSQKILEQAQGTPEK